MSAPGFLQQYRSFLALPDVTPMVLSAFGSRLPIGMMPLALLMFLREAQGSFSAAGFAVGAYFTAMAVVAPVTGRLVDRLGPRRILWVLGPLQPLSMLAVLLVARGGAPFWLVVVCAGLSGVLQPPITVLTRTIWRHRFTTEDDRKRAYSIDAVMIELNFTLGPAFVGLLLATASPTIAYCVVMGIVTLSFAVFMASPLLRYWQQHPPEERHLLGPLTDSRLILLLVTTFGLTFCFGVMEVGYPGYATLLGIPAFGGALLALNALGSATGGALYGGLHFRLSLERQYAAALALLAVPLVLHVWVADHRLLFAAVAFLAGLMIAPSLTAQTMLVARIAPAKYATEAFTWSSTFIVSGLGMGMAVGGSLIEAWGIRPTFLLAALMVLVMAAAALRLPISTAEPVRA